MVRNKFNKNEEYLDVKYKNGRLYSGRIKDSDGEFTLIGSCKKGKFNGQVEVLDNLKNTVWKGKWKMDGYS